MKKYIVKRMKEKMEILHNDWADNYISKKYNEKLETEEAQKIVSKNELNMKALEEQIDSLKKLLKDETK